MPAITAEEVRQNRLTALAALRSAPESQLRCKGVLLDGEGHFCALGYMGHAIGLKFKNSETAYKRIRRAFDLDGRMSLDVTELQDRFGYSWIYIAGILARWWKLP